MKVRLLTTIGTRDADMIGLDRACCAVGSEIEVKRDSADWLFSHGFAVEIKENAKKNKMQTVRAIGKDPSIASAKAPEISE